MSNGQVFTSQAKEPIDVGQRNGSVGEGSYPQAS